MLDLQWEVIKFHNKKCDGLCVAQATTYTFSTRVWGVRNPPPLPTVIPGIFELWDVQAQSDHFYHPVYTPPCIMQRAFLSLNPRKSCELHGLGRG